MYVNCCGGSSVQQVSAFEEGIALGCQYEHTACTCAHVLLLTRYRYCCIYTTCTCCFLNYICSTVARHKQPVQNTLHTRRPKQDPHSNYISSRCTAYINQHSCKRSSVLDMNAMKLPLRLHGHWKQRCGKPQTIADYLNIYPVHIQPTSRYTFALLSNNSQTTHYSATAIIIITTTVGSSSDTACPQASRQPANRLHGMCT